MNCPKCGGDMTAWPSLSELSPHDGYAGVQCKPCGLHWFSLEMEERLDRIIEEAERLFMATNEFPEDAEPEEEDPKP